MLNIANAISLDTKKIPMLVLSLSRLQFLVGDIFFRKAIGGLLTLQIPVTIGTNPAPRPPLWQQWTDRVITLGKPRNDCQKQPGPTVFRPLQDTEGLITSRIVTDCHYGHGHDHRLTDLARISYLSNVLAHAVISLASSSSYEGI